MFPKRLQTSHLDSELNKFTIRAHAEVAAAVNAADPPPTFLSEDCPLPAPYELDNLSWISRFYCLTNSYAPPMPHLCLTIALLNLPNNYVFVIYHTSPWVKLVSTNEMFYLL